MTSRLLVFLSILLLTTVGCATPSPEITPPKTGEEVVARMIEAHGGLEKWRAAPTVSYEATLLFTGFPSPLISRGIVQQRTRRAYLDFPEMGARLSWDGKQAWSENWQGPFPPRFYALHSYYLMNLPWLATDPGVNLSEPGTGRLWDDPIEYITVKLTFEPGVGDTPDDYYILYIHPSSYRLKAAELTVTYAAVLPPDADTSPPFVFVYEGFTIVDGLTVPTSASVYQKDRTAYGSYEWREWSFSEPFDESRMVMPSNAVLDTSSPTRTTKTPK